MKSVAIAALVTIIVVAILAYIVINIMVHFEMKDYLEEGENYVQSTEKTLQCKEGNKKEKYSKTDLFKS